MVGLRARLHGEHLGSDKFWSASKGRPWAAHSTVVPSQTTHLGLDEVAVLSYADPAADTIKERVCLADGQGKVVPHSC